MKKIIVFISILFIYSCSKEEDIKCDCVDSVFRKVTNGTTIVEQWNLNSTTEYKDDCFNNGDVEEYQEDLNGFTYLYRVETNCN